MLARQLRAVPPGQDELIAPRRPNQMIDDVKQRILENQLRRRGQIDPFARRGGMLCVSVTRSTASGFHIFSGGIGSPMISRRSCVYGLRSPPLCQLANIRLTLTCPSVPKSKI